MKSLQLVTFIYFSIFTQLSFAGIVNTMPCASGATYDCIDSIKNIKIGNRTYHMNVVIGEFDTLYTNPQSDLFYWGDFFWAIDAAYAIKRELYAYDPVLSNDNIRWFDSYLYGSTLNLPYIFTAATALPVLSPLPPLFTAKPSPTVSHFNSACVEIHTVGVGSGDCVRRSPKTTLAFAQFTATPIPEPSTLFLLVLGLAGLFWLRKNKWGLVSVEQAADHKGVEIIS